MDTYLELNRNKNDIPFIYVGADPNLKYQTGFIVDEINNRIKVKFFNEILGNFETYLKREDIFLKKDMLLI